MSYRLASISLVLFATAAARADSSVPASHGLQALTARVDLAQLRVRYGRCAAAPCPLTDELPIKLGTTEARTPQLTTVDMAGGKQALWVHVPGTASASWDAILVGSASPVAYADQTGLVNGQDAERSGHKVMTIPDGSGHSFIVRGSTSESYGICGREALAYPEILDPKTLEWKRASFLQLSSDAVDDAIAVQATARQAPADKPLAPLLAARFASSGEHPGAIADGDPATVWTHASVGKGRGELVSFNAPSDVPITRLAITVAPPSPAATGAAPRSFFLATTDQLFAVTMPEDAWSHPGRAYDIVLPKPVKSSCLALVLDDAFVRPGATAVSIAELTAYSELDTPTATLDTVAADLGAGGRRAEAAAGILKRASAAALPPIVKAWPKLDGYGRELALDVASAAPCGSDASQVFLRGVCDADHHVAEKAESALLQCKARSDIVAAAAAVPEAQCSKSSQYLALLGGPGALEPLTLRMAHAPDTATRSEVRHQVATAAQHADSKLLATLAADTRWTPLIRLELLRAMGPRLRELPTEGIASLDALLGAAPDLQLRYLALEPLAELVRAGNPAARTRMSAMLASDADWQVRAHAAELAADVPALVPELGRALDDPQPRVRQAALETIAALHTAPASGAIEKHLGSDPWPFVRVAAADALGALQPTRDADDALGHALASEASSQVKVATLRALAKHHARSQVDAVRSRLDDAQEIVPVRVEAIRALGAMCDSSQLDRLTELAGAAADPMASADDLVLGLASASAIGDIHPADLARRLAKLRDKSVRDAVRNAAEHALASSPQCRP